MFGTTRRRTLCRDCWDKREEDRRFQEVHRELGASAPTAPRNISYELGIGQKSSSSTTATNIFLTMTRIYRFHVERRRLSPGGRPEGRTFAELLVDVRPIEQSGGGKWHNEVFGAEHSSKTEWRNVITNDEEQNNKRLPFVIRYSLFVICYSSLGYYISPFQSSGSAAVDRNTSRCHLPPPTARSPRWPPHSTSSSANVRPSGSPSRIALQ